ncbi:MAG: hypothetical protein WDL87_08700 [Candidatus Omnitrophota bacterium]|jgi:hypothetical protein
MKKQNTRYYSLVLLLITLLLPLNAYATVSNGAFDTINFDTFWKDLSGADYAFGLNYYGTSGNSITASITRDTYQACEIAQSDFLTGPYTLGDTGLLGDYKPADNDFGTIFAVPSSWASYQLYGQDPSILNTSYDTYAKFSVNGVLSGSNHFYGNSLLPAAVTVANNNTLNPVLQWNPVVGATEYTVFVWQGDKNLIELVSGTKYIDISQRVKEFSTHDCGSAITFDGTQYALNLAGDAGLNGGSYLWSVYAGGIPDKKLLDGGSIAGGRLTVTPEPISSLLFLVGGASLAGMRKLRKK